MKTKLRALGIKIAELAQYLEISRPTLYKYIKYYDLGELNSLNIKAKKIFDFIANEKTTSKLDVINYISKIDNEDEFDDPHKLERVLDSDPELKSEVNEIIDRKREAKLLRVNKELDNVLGIYKNTELLLKATINSFHDSFIFSIDSNYCYLYFNDAHKRIMKNIYGHELQIGMNVLDLMTNIVEDLSVVKHNYDIALSGESHSTIEFVRSKEGQKTYYQSFFNPIYDELGIVIGATIFAQDITDTTVKQQETEQLLTERKAMFKEHGAVMLMINPESGKIIDANVSAVKYYGYSKDELLSKTIWDINTIDRETVKSLMKKAKNSEQNIFTFSHKLKSGEIRKVDVNSNPVEYKNEKLLYSIIFDVTERELAKEKLIEAYKSIENEKLVAQKYLDIAGVIMLVLDVKGNIQLINEKGSSVLGLEKNQIIGKKWIDYFIPDEYKEEINNLFDTTITSPNGFETLDYENQIIDSKGNLLDILWHNTKLYDVDGNTIGVLCSGEDVTERNHTLKILEQNEKNLLITQKIAKIGSWRLDVISNEVTQSEELKKIYGFDPKLPSPDLMEHKKVFTPESWKKLSTTLELTRTQGVPYELELETVTKDGSNGWIWVKGEAEKDEHGKIIAIRGVAQDITERKEQEEKLIYLNYHDTLTGLYNRRYYEENLLKIDNPKNYPLSIVMSDINGLKLINDAFGHVEGDKLLVSAAKVISETCRKTDSVIRIGGDEFLIIMPNTSRTECGSIIEEINNKFKNIKVESIELSMSFGYKTKNNHKQNMQELFRDVEDLMYREKLSEIPSMRRGAINTIMEALNEKDSDSEVHSRNVSEISEKIAAEYGMDRQEINEVKTAALLHDIGKIIIPISIIAKAGKLTEEEYDLVKGHPEIGFRILNSSPDMRDISNIVLNHHERWDGTGYPRGLKTEEIPIQSRIISIADAFDAMTSKRTYRNLLSNQEALDEIIRYSGTQFDPDVVKLFSDKFDIIVDSKK